MDHLSWNTQYPAEESTSITEPDAREVGFVYNLQSEMCLPVFIDLWLFMLQHK